MKQIMKMEIVNICVRTLLMVTIVIAEMDFNRTQMIRMIALILMNVREIIHVPR